MDGLLLGLKRGGVLRTPKVEQAMKAVNRLNYSAAPGQAFHDSPHSIGYGQTISAPHMHAHCLEHLKDLLVPGARVLDVGAGSGYLTACFAHLIQPSKENEKGGLVVGIEIVPELVNFAYSNIKRGNPELLDWIILQESNAWEKLASELFDVIHVGAAAETCPQSLLDKLRPGGRMLIPVGSVEQSLMMYSKDGKGSITVQRLMGVRYVPLVKQRRS